MKKAFLLLGIIIAAFILSCNGNSTKGEKSSVDTIWNENVQDKFFGVSFGESKETLIETFKKEGFVADLAISTEEIVYFSPTKSKYYSFGGCNWEMLDITFSNDKFVGIRFMNSSKDRAEAMSQYEQLKKLVTNKYKETILEKKDTTVYGQTVIFSKDTNAHAACYRYESISKNILIGISLEYFSKKYYKGAEDEL